MCADTRKQRAKLMGKQICGGGGVCVCVCVCVGPLGGSRVCMLPLSNLLKNGGGGGRTYKVECSGLPPPQCIPALCL